MLSVGDPDLIFSANGASARRRPCSPPAGRRNPPEFAHVFKPDPDLCADGSFLGAPEVPRNPPETFVAAPEASFARRKLRAFRFALPTGRGRFAHSATIPWRTVSTVGAVNGELARPLCATYRRAMAQAPSFLRVLAGKAGQ